MKNSRFVLIIGLVFFVFQNVLMAEEFATFESFYVESSSIGWILTGIVVIGAVLLIPFTGGATGVAAIGTFIGNTAGLTGIAATNYGLALIGFGSLTTGGLGVAGGTAILTMALTFSTEVVMDYTVSTAMNTYSHSKFVEDSKKMITLPIPQNEDGSDDYEKLVEFLKENIDKEQRISTEKNQKILHQASEKFKINSDDEEYRMKDYVLRSYLYFVANDYENAKKNAKNAIELAREQRLRRTLPAYIYAVSTLYEENFDFDNITEKYFRYSVLAEPDNKLIPLMFAIYLDRILYRMNDDEDLNHKSLDSIKSIAFDIEDEDIKTQSLVIVLMRYITRVKIEQQKILSLCESENDTIKDNPKTLQDVRNSLKEYKELLKSAKTILTYSSVKNSIQKNKELENLFLLNAKYEESTRYLGKIIDELENHQVQLTKSKVLPYKGTNYKPIILIISGLSLLFIVLILGWKYLSRFKIK